MNCQLKMELSSKESKFFIPKLLRSDILAQLHEGIEKPDVFPQSMTHTNPVNTQDDVARPTTKTCEAGRKESVMTTWSGHVVGQPHRHDLDVITCMDLIMGTLCEDMYTSTLINSWLSIRATGIQCSVEPVT